MIKDWVAEYKLTKLYPGLPPGCNSIGIEVNYHGWTKGGTRLIDFPYIWTDYFEKIKNKLRIGVIIGRFQLPEPHSGHIKLYEHVKSKSDFIVFIIGNAAIPLTDKNPLNVYARIDILSKHFGSMHAYTAVIDNICDYKWSQEVDAKIWTSVSSSGISMRNDIEITLYGSRDSFIPNYHGKYKIELIEASSFISSTQTRAFIKNKRISDLRTPQEGIIYAIENKYPVAYPTVDIAILKLVQPAGTPLYTITSLDKTYILLGRKPGEVQWRFPGGFVDPKDLSLEDAARRELSEEVKGITTHPLYYISSHKVDDWRYRGTKDGIMTSLFLTYHLGGEPKAGDDLEEVKWFDLDDFTKSPDFWSTFFMAHKPLMISLLNDLKK